MRAGRKFIRHNLHIMWGGVDGIHYSVCFRTTLGVPVIIPAVRRDTHTENVYFTHCHQPMKTIHVYQENNVEIRMKSKHSI